MYSPEPSSPALRDLVSLHVYIFLSGLVLLTAFLATIYTCTVVNEQTSIRLSLYHDCSYGDAIHVLDFNKKASVSI